MFEALEDMPKQHAYAIDFEADKMATPNEILENMDELYGVKMTFQALSVALCGLQQRPTESCRDYYDRMVQITVLLCERHSNRFRPGELTRMTKEYFYLGLRPEHRPIVAHLKDRPNASCMSLLIAYKRMSRTMLRLARDTRPILLLVRMASPNPSRRIDQLTVGSVGLMFDLSRWSRKMTAILCSQYTWGLSQRRSMTTKTSLRTLILIIGWTRDSTLAWFKQQTLPTHGSVAASTAWKRVIVGESALSCLCCQSCKEYSTERL